MLRNLSLSLRLQRNRDEVAVIVVIIRERLAFVRMVLRFFYHVHIYLARVLRYSFSLCLSQVCSLSQPVFF